MSTSTYHQHKIGDIVHLNVGGTRFSTSWQTLMWVPDSFFTALLSGRIPSLRDETGAIFIDRDPKMFSIILNYLRTKEVDLRDVNIRTLRHESDYFGITPLSRRLALCDEMTHSTCGDVLFYGYLPPPANLTPTLPVCSRPSQTKQPTSSRTDGLPGSRSHSRNSSLDLRLVGRVTTTDQLRCTQGHSRTASLDLRNGSQELSKPVMPRCDLNGWPEHLKVQIIKAHHNWIVVAYSHLVVGYRLTDTCGWGVVFQSPVQEAPIERVALNAKVGGGEVMLGIACGSLIKLWAIASHADPIRRTLVGTFNLGVRVEHLLFIGPQLVALSSSGGRCSNGGATSGTPANGSNNSSNSGNTAASNNNNNGVSTCNTTGGKAGVWHTSTQHWQVQDIAPLTSFDTAGSFLLLGTINGAINYIDMQKFPLRMKDNDLLVTQLYKDPNHEPITAISVYLTPKTSLCGNWIEIAYGTRGGSVRVIVQHPETVGHGPQLFQTFTVHQSPVTKVSLSEKYLVSVCSEYNHVRSWKVTRFRGMISTQPGTTPEASFKVLSLEPSDPSVSSANDCGPYGEQDEEQLFVQKVVHETDTLYIRRASDGKRVCVVKSVDGSMVSCFVVMECEGTLRPRRLLLTGHCSGATHMWDLTTALDRLNDPSKDSEQSTGGGPSADELVRLVEHCNLQCTAPSSPHRPLM